MPKIQFELHHGGRGTILFEDIGVRYLIYV